MPNIEDYIDHINMLYNLHHVYDEDHRQILLINLWQALQHYDETKENAASVKTYLNRCFDNILCTIYRNEKRNHMLYTVPVDCDGYDDPEDYSFKDMCSNLEWMEIIDEIGKEVKKKLGLKYYKIYNWRMQGYTDRYIAKQLKVSAEMARQYRKKISLVVQQVLDKNEYGKQVN